MSVQSLSVNFIGITLHKVDYPNSSFQVRISYPEIVISIFCSVVTDIFMKTVDEIP